MNAGSRHFYGILAIGLLFHITSSLYNFENTYDAYVHMFFAEHYASSWFDTWEYRWYTGFTVTSYPPLVHHIVALLSKWVGLKMGFLIWSWVVVAILIRGVYRFSQIFFSERIALYAALATVFSTAVCEALHIFGQLPSLTGTALLVNACSEIYLWLRRGGKLRFLSSISLIAMTSAAHHVSTIFGMVFFVFPVIGIALFDLAQMKKSAGQIIGIQDFIRELWTNLRRIVFFGFSAGGITLLVTFPYWIWSKSDPITQVPIPHGSRDNFLEVLSSGLVFFLIPWGIILLLLPFVLRRLTYKRHVFLALSFVLLFILGTGGTTPIPRTILGENAFQILTLDRFTFWGSILVLPFVGLFLFELLEGRIKSFLEDRIGRMGHRLLAISFLISFMALAIVTSNLSAFKKLQPETIDIQPIVNFLHRDDHDKWRYLTLGFGDQMAWLSANTKALTVDGNYHSARRLTELTSRAVERLENAKYLGNSGLTSLQQFLTVPEKYHLKYIFSNDQFYDPLLHFAGWQKLQELENKIAIWERLDVPPLPQVLPRKDIPSYQRLMWGVLPLSTVLFVVFIHLILRQRGLSTKVEVDEGLQYKERSRGSAWWFHLIWAILVSSALVYIVNQNAQKTTSQASPSQTIKSFFHALDFKDFNLAYSYLDPTSRPSLEQYLLELSLDGGMLSSYVKLDSLSIQTLGENSQGIQTLVTATWTTSLSAFVTEHHCTVRKQRGKFYLMPESYPRRRPAETFGRDTEVTFVKQGRRSPLVGSTDKQDVLDRPDGWVSNSTLVRHKDSYAVLGEFFNIDVDPAFVTIEAILYDSLSNEIARYSAMDGMIHYLLPKESTPFLIDFSSEFERLAMSGQDTVTSQPSRFVLFVRTSVAGFSPYRSIGFQNLKTDSQESISGELYNYGTDAISIPQVLMAYQDDSNAVKWVSRNYLSSGVRPHRFQSFLLPLKPLDHVEILHAADDSQIFINGSSRSYYRSLTPELESTGPAIELDSNVQLRIYSNILTLQPYID